MPGWGPVLAGILGPVVLDQLFGGDEERRANQAYAGASATAEEERRALQLQRQLREELAAYFRNVIGGAEETAGQMPIFDLDSVLGQFPAFEGVQLNSDDYFRSLAPFAIRTSGVQGLQSLLTGQSPTGLSASLAGLAEGSLREQENALGSLAGQIARMLLFRNQLSGDPSAGSGFPFAIDPSAGQVLPFYWR